MCICLPGGLHAPGRAVRAGRAARRTGQRGGRRAPLGRNPRRAGCVAGGLAGGVRREGLGGARTCAPKTKGSMLSVGGGGHLGVPYGRCLAMRVRCACACGCSTDAPARAVSRARRCACAPCTCGAAVWTRYVSSTVYGTAAAGRPGHDRRAAYSVLESVRKRRAPQHVILFCFGLRAASPKCVFFLDSEWSTYFV